MYNIQKLTYENNSIVYKEAKKVAKSEHSVAIVVHVFYLDIWEEIQAYISGLNMGYDLYITLPHGTAESDIIKIFQQQPHIYVYMTENRGRDVLPFLQVMSLIDNAKYQYICKLHTKKTNESALGNVWRKLLYFDLLGSHETVTDILKCFDDEEIAIVTGKNTILDSQRYSYGNSKNIEALALQTGIIYDEHYLFPAGTMFWIRPSLVKPLVSLFQENKLHFEDEAGQKDDTLAHAIERFFGILAQVQNKKIVESPAYYSKLPEQTLVDTAKLVLSQQYVGTNVFAMQKQKIQARDERILELEALAQSLRLKNRLKNLLSEKIMPLIKKIVKIPKKLFSIVKLTIHNPALLKKVFYYAKHGDIKYLYSKIKEKSRNNLSESEKLTKLSPSSYLSPIDKKRYTLNHVIDIIIPVYNGFEFLEKLFDSIEKNTTSEYRLIVVEDCSPDEKVKPYLIKRLKKHPTSILLEHTENQGFLKSVNEAYTYTNNHFTLLNTDTEVPHFWLERLMYPIVHMDKVASTTPFTNSGEIASFPHFVADNEIFDNMDVDRLDSIFQNVNADNFYASMPTGVGFCMGVNYTLTKKIGMFVEDTFGKGYGEENDWCQRAIQMGYKNYLVPNLFVYHKHGGSFSAEEKASLLKENAVKLLDRHPNYGKDVHTYIQKNPHHTLRQLLVVLAADMNVGTHIIFDHHLGGGANIYADELVSAYKDENKSIIHIKYDYYAHSFKLYHTYKTYDFSFECTSFDEIEFLLSQLHINEIFLNSLVSYKNTYHILEYIQQLVENKKIVLTIPLHDFYALCPSYTLLNEKGKYCSIPSLDRCKVCMQNNMQEWRNFYGDEVDMPKWRTVWFKILMKSNHILCFSNASKEILQKAYPELNDTQIKVIPHTVTPLKPVVSTHQSDVTTIGILGAINYAKGAKIVKDLVHIIQRDNLDIRIVVIGEITESIHSKQCISTGRYKREDLPTIIQEYEIDLFLIPSIWPETFSYTTQEIMMMKMPLMVFDLGAPAERVRHYDKGLIIEEQNAQSVIETIMKQNKLK